MSIPSSSGLITSSLPTFLTVTVNLSSALTLNLPSFSVAEIKSLTPDSLKIIHFLFVLILSKTSLPVIVLAFAITTNFPVTSTGKVPFVNATEFADLTLIFNVPETPALAPLLLPNLIVGVACALLTIMFTSLVKLTTVELAT